MRCREVHPLFVLLAALAGCDADLPCTVHPVVAIGTAFFTDVSAPSGIQLGNFDPAPAMPIPSNNHARLGFVDLDGDSYDDIVMHSLFINVRAGIPYEHLVFMANGDGTFRDASEGSGLRAVQAGFFVFGDVDNDGDEDCFAGLDEPIAGMGNAIYLNDGAGHFTKKDDASFAATIGATYTGNAVFADFNGDARLDLFVGNGQTSEPSIDQLYLGNGDGSFTEAADRLRGNDTYRMTNGLVACDYDDDGDLDVFVSTYGISVELGHNELWRNDGTGAFDRVGELSGFAAQATGNSWLESTGHGTLPEPDSIPASWVGSNGFGVDCQDVNGDGLPDIYLATISHPDEPDHGRKWSDPSQLLINLGPGGGFSFVNETLLRGLPFNEGDIDNAIIDFDNDGLMDLAVGREAKYDLGYRKEFVEQKAWLGLFHGLPDGKYESVGLTSGINDPTDTSRIPRMKGAGNLGWSDIDHDGDLDLLVGGGGTPRPNFLFRNEIGSKNAWLGFRLRGDGVEINRDAIGARVTIRTDAGRVLVRELKSSRGTYDSMDTRALLFGLGDLGCDYRIEVRWPNGVVEAVERDQLVPADTEGGEAQTGRYVTITYRQGVGPAR